MRVALLLLLLGSCVKCGGGCIYLGAGTDLSCGELLGDTFGLGI